MALVLADRVKETTTTAGTGTITLAGAATGFQSFAAVGNSNTTYYTISGGSEWEVGIGTYSSTGPTLSRDTVLSSSAGGAKVSFSAGTKDVFVTYPAGKAIADGYGLLPVPNGGTGAATLTGYVKGNGTSAFTASATVPTSDVSGGAALTKTDDTNVTLTLGGSPTTALLAATSLTLGWTGSLAATRGGTGQTSYAVGDILYASTTTALSKLAGVATGNALISGGVGAAPSWGKIGLTTHVSGTLGVGNGGTGTTTTLTTGSIVFAGASGVYSQDNANLFWDDTNNRLGIGTSTPTEPLSVLSSGLDVALFESTDTGAAAGPVVTLFRNSASPAAADVGGRINFDGESSTSVQRTYASIITDFDTVTNAAEDASLRLVVMRAGTLTSVFDISGGAGLVSLTNTTGFSINRTNVTAPAAGDGNVFSGTYTPTLTNTTNIAASTAAVCQYMRVGNVVTVSGQVSIDPTATGRIVMGMTLPIASALSGATQLGGTFVAAGVTTVNLGSVSGDATNDRATFDGVVADTANRIYYFSFTYQVL
jgi:hypothetical protein